MHMPEERERDGSSLPELLQLATPNLADGQGDTVLHILLLRSGDGEVSWRATVRMDTASPGLLMQLMAADTPHQLYVALKDSDGDVSGGHW